MEALYQEAERLCQQVNGTAGIGPLTVEDFLALLVGRHKEGVPLVGQYTTG